MDNETEKLASRLATMVKERTERDNAIILAEFLEQTRSRQKTGSQSKIIRGR